MNSEQWRKLPGGPYLLSNLGRLKNRQSRLVTPCVKLGTDRARYEIKPNGVYKTFIVDVVMARIWPEVCGSYDRDWVARVRQMNGKPPVPRHIAARRYSASENDWDRDPWETMHLWDQGRDYRNFAQYVPVI